MTLPIAPPLAAVEYLPECSGDAVATSGGDPTPNEVVTISGCTIRYGQPLPVDCSHRLKVTHHSARQ